MPSSTSELKSLAELLPFVCKNLQELVGSDLPVSVTADGAALHVGPCAFRVKELRPLARTTRIAEVARAEADQLPSLVIAESIPERLGQQLRQQGQYYADAMGNVWVLAEAVGLRLLVSGLRARRLTTVTGAAFQTQGLRLVFHLLTNSEWLLLPNLNLAKRTRVPLQATTDALLDLEEQGFLQVGNGRRLTNVAALTARWAAGYAAALRPQLPVQRYRWQAGIDPNQAWHSLARQTRTLWSGAMAARRLLGASLEVPTVTLYAGTSVSYNLLQRVGLEPLPGGSVEVLRLFAVPGVESRDYCVHPLLVYADLLALGDEASKHVAAQVLAHFLPQLVAE